MCDDDDSEVLLSSVSHRKLCTFYNDVGYVSNRNDHAYSWSTHEGYITRRSQILHLKFRVYYGSLVEQEIFRKCISL